MSKNMGSLLKQLQKAQTSILKAQEELAKKTVEGSSGGGMVLVTMNGSMEITQIKLEKDAVNPEDIEMLQDLILAAINDARDKASKLVESEMKSFGLGQGLNIPGLF